MTIWSVGWMQGGTYTAQHDRINSRANDWDEGVKNRSALKVTQRGAGANLSVDVAAGNAVVTGDDQTDQGNYNVYSDAVTNVTGFTAPATNSRYDLVGIQINDPNAGGAAGSNATIIRVAGTAAASPVIPTIPASFLVLAIVGPILPATTSITDSMIHDAHTGTGPTGVTSVRLVSGFRDRPGTSKETYATVADSGWAMEYGQAVSRTTYAALFEELSTTHGVGDGATTFNLPDSRGRVAVALDNMGGSDAGLLSSANALGTKMGAETHTLTQAELPNVTLSINPPSTAVTITDPGHAHSENGDATQQVDIVTSGSFVQAPTGPTTTGTSTTGITAVVDIAPFDSPALGSGTAHSIMQPSITVNRMIRLT